ncbi:hypothetical protein L6164_005854 [Bauhinia variegata]|uniref:Uncharacterized protein n=1 Tax=Bauhinia variegata TaxID=167791 RepID=A0ACB9PSJ0_BAUVA|nr:hypothetical protein L6164_005854 [Bauhinia variegata]
MVYDAFRLTVDILHDNSFLENETSNDEEPPNKKFQRICAKPLIEISRIFKDLCCITLRMEDLVRLEQNILIIICKLERIFSPGFFDTMEHILIHLPMKQCLVV